MNVIFLGTAGSGKTSLCNAYGDWLKTDRDQNVKFINLDPGAVEYLPYAPDFDIRNYFTVPKIMKRENLGPNGAIIRANELMLEKSATIIRKIGSLDSDFNLIDTPGQLEPFVFKEAGKILQDLQTISPTVGVFLIDAALTQYASNLIVGLLLAIAVQIQLGFNMVYVLHKADLLSQRNKLVKMLEDPPYLRKQIIREHRGALTDLALSAHDAVSNLTGPMRIITTSAAGSQLGLEDLHDLLNESFCACGDLT